MSKYKKTPTIDKVFIETMCKLLTVGDFCSSRKIWLLVVLFVLKEKLILLVTPGTDLEW